MMRDFIDIGLALCGLMFNVLAVLSIFELLPTDTPWWAYMTLGLLFGLRSER